MTALPNPWSDMIVEAEQAEPAPRNIDHLIDMEALERAIAETSPDSIDEAVEIMLQRCRDEFFSAVKR